MEAKETVRALTNAVQSGDFKTAKSYLADDFQFSGPVPEPMDGEAWMGISAILRKAFPDLNYGFNIEGAEGNAIKMSAQLSGTHSGNLDLTKMGMGVIPATGKTVSLARETGTAMVRGDKVSSLEMKPTEGAGLMAMLSKLGFSVPSK